MSQITVAQFEQHVLNVFESDANIRKSSTLFIETCATNTPDLYCMMQIALFKSSNNKQVCNQVFLKFYCVFFFYYLYKLCA